MQLTRHLATVLIKVTIRHLADITKLLDKGDAVAQRRRGSERHRCWETVGDEQTLNFLHRPQTCKRLIGAHDLHDNAPAVAQLKARDPSHACH